MLAHFVRSARQTWVPRHRDVGTKALAVAFASHAFSTTAVATTHQLRVPRYMIWGANTDVGKTLVSAGLAAAARRNKVCRVLASSLMQPLIMQHWTSIPHFVDRH